MSLSIDGTTKLAGIIGSPLDHTLSPAMHNAVYEQLGLNWVYVPLPVTDSRDLPAVVAALRVLPFVGFNVTMPYKQDVLELCDEVAETARMAGAVNTVHVRDGRLIGYNTDGRGLLEALAEEAGVDPEGLRVTILGAGGAASGAFVAFVVARAARILVVNRTVERAEELIGRASGHLRGTVAEAVPWERAEEAVHAADLVVNCTSLGMDPNDQSPVPSEWLEERQVVYDMVYCEGETPLMRASREAGALAFDGLGMLVRQGATAVDIWNESAQVRTPRDVMRAAAEAELAARAWMQGPE
jgi:shikimate dehydrogenase